MINVWRCSNRKPFMAQHWEHFGVSISLKDTLTRRLRGFGVKLTLLVSEDDALSPSPLSRRSLVQNRAPSLRSVFPKPPGSGPVSNTSGTVLCYLHNSLCSYIFITRYIMLVLRMRWVFVPGLPALNVTENNSGRRRLSWITANLELMGKQVLAAGISGLCSFPGSEERVQLGEEAVDAQATVCQ